MDAGTEWVMCGRKKSFRTFGEAQRIVSRMTEKIILRVYQCPVCCLWHLTKTPEVILRCDCGKRLDPFLPAGPCVPCARMTEEKAIDGIKQLMYFFKFLHKLPHRVPNQKKKTEEEKNLEDFSRSINAAAVYLLKRKSS